MNWRRGIFRLWAALSVIWVALMVWRKYAETANIPDPPAGFRIEGGLRDSAFWVDVTAMPLVAGVVILLAVWIASGFRKPT
jgi:hypothetical protein